MDRGLIVLDLDGTLVDTRTAMERAYITACTEVGLRDAPPFEEYVQHLGAPLAEILERMRLPAEIAGHFKATAKNLLHLVSISSDLVVALRAFRSQGHTLALFTGKDSERTWDMLRHFAVDTLFDLVVTGDDVTKGKPDPEGLLNILSETEISAKCAVYVGDSRYDVLCARRAGVASVAVAWGMASRQDLIDACPTRLIEQPSEFFSTIFALLAEQDASGDEHLSDTRQLPAAAIVGN